MSEKLFEYSEEQHAFLADPSAPRVANVPLGLVFHTFTGDDNVSTPNASLPR